MDPKLKLRDSRMADNIIRIAEKDLDLAERVCMSLRDREARIMCLLNLYRFTSSDRFLHLAIEMAESDEDYLRVIEYSDRSDLACVAEMISDDYRRDLAYSILLERSGDLNYAVKIKDIRLLSAAMKRLSSRKIYPENLTLARMIPDAYYRCLALIEISNKEGIDLSKEIELLSHSIPNKYLRERVLKMHKG